ncbi:hypothetical protein LCGC14_2249970, partial [marine sediment metagenome]
MKRILSVLILILVSTCAWGQGSAIPPYITQYWRSVLDEPNPVHQPLSADSTTFFQLKDQAGNVDFNYDSTNGRVSIGT